MSATAAPVEVPDIGDFDDVPVIEILVSVGDTVACEGCHRTLIVYHHVSRLHGAYLGYMVDAEEPTT